MIYKEDIFLNEAYWRGMGTKELDQYAYRIYDYYRQEGFPYYPIDKESRDKNFDSLINYDRTTLFQEDVVKQTMHGLGLAWSYFPNAFDVKCGNKLTPLEAFNDDNIFLNVIRKRLSVTLGLERCSRYTLVFRACQISDQLLLLQYMISSHHEVRFGTCLVVGVEDYLVQLLVELNITMLKEDFIGYDFQN